MVSHPSRPADSLLVLVPHELLLRLCTKQEAVLVCIGEQKHTLENHYFHSLLSLLPLPPLSTTHSHYYRYYHYSQDY